MGSQMFLHCETQGQKFCKTETFEPLCPTGRDDKIIMLTCIVEQKMKWNQVFHI